MGANDRLLFLITVAQLAVKNYASKALSAAGAKVTLAQSGVLFLLAQRDRRMMSEIGGLLGIENSAMTGLIDRLEKSGLVTRNTDTDDRRALFIGITPAGLEEARRAGRIIRRVNDEIKTVCSEQELEDFKRVLEGILKKFGKA
ncbi:MAG: MarR family transcriptional regulator [Thermodesulfobacteriota bacterium]